MATIYLVLIAFYIDSIKGATSCLGGLFFKNKNGFWEIPEAIL